MDYKASHAAGAMEGTSEGEGGEVDDEEGDERSDSDYDSDYAEQSQRGDTRPDGGTMTRDGFGDGAGDQEQDDPAGMGWIGQPGQHGEWHPGLSRPDRG